VGHLDDEEHVLRGQVRGAVEVRARPDEPARWREHPTVRFLALAGAVLAAYHGVLHATGPSRMTESLRARLAGGPATVDVLVTTRFPPEEFHIRLLQQVGTMRGVEGRTASLSTVTPANVRYIARHYWIERIDLAPGDRPGR
jgi:hypothetical protein